MNAETTGAIGIRPLVAGEIDAAMELAAALPTAPHWPRAAYEAAADPAASPRRLALAVELDERLAAFAVASLLGGEAELETVCVDPARQRQGLARRLLSALSQAVEEAGAERLSLEVRAGNAAALALYRAFGFREVARRPRYYTNPEEDALVMDLRLGGTRGYSGS